MLIIEKSNCSTESWHSFLSASPWIYPSSSFLLSRGERLLWFQSWHPPVEASVNQPSNRSHELLFSFISFIHSTCHYGNEDGLHCFHNRISGYQRGKRGTESRKGCWYWHPQDHSWPQQLFTCPMRVTTGQGEGGLNLKREVRMGDNPVAVTGVQIILTPRSLRRPSW